MKSISPGSGRHECTRKCPVSRGEMSRCLYLQIFPAGSWLSRCLVISVALVMLISFPGLFRCAASASTGPSSREVPSSPRSLRAIASVAPSLTRDLEAMGLEYGSPIFMRAFKEERELEIWVENDGVFHLFRVYPVAGLSGWLGPKRYRGDLQAPEGFYRVTPSQMNPDSRFHLAFDLGYPNEYDRARHRTGSSLMIHGRETSMGCFAMTDEAMEEIYALADAALRNGQEAFYVHSFPFRMTDENMEFFREYRWYYFWATLRTGHDLFEKTGRPPEVSVEDGEYVFSPCGG